MNIVIIILTLITSLILLGIGMLLYLTTRSKTEQNNEITEIFNPLSQSINNLDKVLGKGMEKVEEKINSLNNDYTNSTKIFDEANQINGKLAAVLSNNSARGVMGEKIAENLLDNLGMVKQVDYKLQEKVGGDIPDIIINLPHNKILCIDVKFPMDNFRKMHDAEEKGNKKESEAYKNDFKKDIKGHIDDVSKRDYTNPDYGCYHRATIFIPNEQILYFMLEQKIKDGSRTYSVLEYADKKNIDLSSPVLFVVSINQIKSIQKEMNQMHNMQSIKKAFESVELEFDNFFEGPKGFIKLGEFIDKTHERFNELKTTRADKLRRSFKSSKELSINENKDKLVQEISLN